MRLLIVEDEGSFVEQIRGAATASGLNIVLITSKEIGLEDPFDEGTSYEEQLLKLVKEANKKHSIDLVLLDSDLSRMPSRIAQSMCRQAFQDVGLPVCRYKKRHSSTPARDLQDLRRTAREGASAIWVPNELVQPQNLTSQLMPWLVAVSEGFGALRETLRTNQPLLEKSQGPAGILAIALKRPEAKADFLGYTAQNFFFFGSPAGEDEDDPTGTSEVLATQLGYWLFNSILRFPGPILSLGAAAAYINVKTAELNTPGMGEALEVARYKGPFCQVEPFYWRDDLSSLLNRLEGDIVNAPQLKGAKVARVDEVNPGSSAFFCVLTQQPIPEEESAPNPDWIPPGAQLARIQRKLYDKLGPMLSV
jgi:hypothetical protein